MIAGRKRSTFAKDVDGRCQDEIRAAVRPLLPEGALKESRTSKDPLCNQEPRLKHCSL